MIQLREQVGNFSEAGYQNQKAFSQAHQMDRGTW